MPNREWSAEDILLLAVRRALLALVGALEIYLKARGVEVLLTQAARRAAKESALDHNAHPGYTNLKVDN
jgi:hypothetical protein